VLNFELMLDQYFCYEWT